MNVGETVQRKNFFKKTRRGKVIRLIREKYIRNDLGMGYMGGNIVTHEKLFELVSQAPHKHILVIDTNVALSQIDFFEHKTPATSPVIVLQTVLQELRHLNISTYRRMLALMQDESRSFIFFPNEHCSETASVRLQNDSDNDFNDRLIRDATNLFASVLSAKQLSDSNSDDDEEERGETAGSQCTAILLTNDVANRRFAEKEGLQCFSIHKYIKKFLREYPELLDLLTSEVNVAVESA